jgi:hypothetical protein
LLPVPIGLLFWAILENTDGLHTSLMLLAAVMAALLGLFIQIDKVEKRLHAINGNTKSRDCERDDR